MNDWMELLRLLNIPGGCTIDGVERERAVVDDPDMGGEDGMPGLETTLTLLIEGILLARIWPLVGEGERGAVDGGVG